MSEAPEITEETPSLKPKFPTTGAWIRGLVMVVLAFVGIAVLISTGRMQTRRAEEGAYTRMGDAVAQSMVPEFLERNWKKTENELIRIAKAGNFAEITLTDVDGHVVASTNRTPANPETLKSAPATARVSSDSAHIRIERKVWLAQDNALGAMRILVRR